MVSVSCSAPSPLHRARNTALYCYRPPYALPPISDLLDSPSIHDNLIQPNRRSCLQICFLYFCRITEVLTILSSDIIHPDRAVCHGAKGSNSYVIFLPGLSASVAAFNQSDTPFRLFPFTYIQLYRDCVRAGIQFSVSGSVNNRRLHSARYVFAQIGVDKMSDATLSQCLRHRSLTSLQYYL